MRIDKGGQMLRGSMWNWLLLSLLCCSFVSSFHPRVGTAAVCSKAFVITSRKLIRCNCIATRYAMKVDGEVEEDVVFAGVKFPPPVSTSLHRLGIADSPSPIQQAAVAPICSGMSCILHAATGTGKTYAFLLPALKKLFAANNAKTFRTPLQVLIIVPTKELALQVEADAQKLLNGDASMVYTYLTRLPHDHDSKSNNTPSTNNLEVEEEDKSVGNKNYREAPIWITTPMKLLNLLRDLTSTFRYDNANQVLAYFSNIKYMVIDEADRVIPPPNRYIYKGSDSTKEKLEQVRKADIATTPFVKSGNENAVFQSMDMILSATKARYVWFQVVAASATVGRPLRRELYRLVNNVNENVKGTRVIDHEYGGQFPVIRPADVNSKVLFSAGKVNGVEGSTEGSPVDTRYISIPRGIQHYLLFSEEMKKDNVGARLALINNECLLEKSVLQQKYGRIAKKMKGLIFIPEQDEVPQALRILRFWGYSNASFIPGYPDEMPEVFTPPHAKVRKDIELFIAPYSGTRGLHIPEINHVFVLKAPKTMDEYLHLAGRTGRLQVSLDGKVTQSHSVQGSVVTIVDDDDWKRMRSWQTPLGISFQPLV